MIWKKAARGESVKHKIRTLVRLEAFDTSAENNIYEESIRSQIRGTNHSTDADAPKDLQRIITELCYGIYGRMYKNIVIKISQLRIVLDEMQNLDHRPDSPIDKLREGRKFGISLIWQLSALKGILREAGQAAHRRRSGGGRRYDRPHTKAIRGVSMINLKRPVNCVICVTRKDCRKHC